MSNKRRANRPNNRKKASNSYKIKSSEAVSFPYEKLDNEKDFMVRLKDHTEYFFIFSSVLFVVSVIDISITISSLFSESTLARFNPEYGIGLEYEKTEYSARVIEFFMSEHWLAAIPIFGILVFLLNGATLYYYTDTNESRSLNFDEAEKVSEKYFSAWKTIFLGCITMSMLIIAIFATWKGW